MAFWKNLLKKPWFILILGIILGGLGASFLISKEKTVQDGKGSIENDAAVWTCSMHPQIKLPEPGDCPICGMDLIPLNVEEGNSQGDFTISEEMARLGNISSIPIEKKVPEATTHLQGKVEYDESRISLISSDFPGRVEKLFISFTGQEVRKGERLATIYSPELISAQKELLEAAKLKEINPNLYTAARQKLLNWNLRESQINSIESGGEIIREITIFSPYQGVVLKRHVSLGEYVKGQAPLFEIVDLSRVWLVFEAYETDLPLISLGDEIEYFAKAFPGRKMHGKVSYLDPVIDPVTRTLQIRSDVSNSDRVLKPEMFISGEIAHGAVNRDSILSVPGQSVLWMGDRAIVYVVKEKAGKSDYELREIIVGPQVGNDYVVLEGLEEGERVVNNGAFKVDAAFQLAGESSMMNLPPNEEEGLKEQENEHSSHVMVRGETSSKLEDLFWGYIEIKNGLVESSLPDVLSSVPRLEFKVENLDVNGFSPDDHQFWLENKPKILETLGLMRRSTDLDSARILFSFLSEVTIDMAHQFPVNSVPIFQDFCPMAIDDNGARWISEMRSIRNPYFGEQMLQCGELQETLYPIEVNN